MIVLTMGMTLVVESSIISFQPDDLERGPPRLWAHLGVPPQPSAVQWKSADMSSMWGTRHGGRQAHTAVLEPPQSWCTQVDGAVAMIRALPFAPACTSVPSAEFQLNVGNSDPYHVSQRTWTPGKVALVKIPELQDPAIGTSYELLLVWFLAKRTFSAFAPLSWGQKVAPKLHTRGQRSICMSVCLEIDKWK